MKGVEYENCKTFLKFKIRWEIKKLHNKYSQNSWTASSAHIKLLKLVIENNN